MLFSSTATMLTKLPGSLWPLIRNLRSSDFISIVERKVGPSMYRSTQPKATAKDIKKPLTVTFDMLEREGI